MITNMTVDDKKPIVLTDPVAQRLLAAAKLLDAAKGRGTESLNVVLDMLRRLDVRRVEEGKQGEKDERPDAT